MELKVIVPEITLATVVADVFSVDEDGESYQDGVETVGDKVAKIISKEVMRSPSYNSLRDRVTTIRDEEIVKALTPIIDQALHNPIQKTNGFGHPVGEPTTLEELIMDAAKKAWTLSRNNYGDREKSIDQVIAEQVRKHLHAEVAKAVKEAQEAALKAVGELAAAPVVEAVRKALGK